MPTLEETTGTSRQNERDTTTQSVHKNQQKSTGKADDNDMDFGEVEEDSEGSTENEYTTRDELDLDDQDSVTNDEGLEKSDEQSDWVHPSVFLLMRDGPRYDDHGNALAIARPVARRCDTCKEMSSHHRHKCVLLLSSSQTD